MTPHNRYYQQLDSLLNRTADSEPGRETYRPQRWVTLTVTKGQKRKGKSLWRRVWRWLMSQVPY